MVKKKTKAWLVLGQGDGGQSGGSRVWERAQRRW
jgi:hypothetical protein